MTRPRSQAPTLASTSVPTAKRGGCTTHAWNLRGGKTVTVVVRSVRRGFRRIAATQRKGRRGRGVAAAATRIVRGPIARTSGASVGVSETSRDGAAAGWSDASAPWTCRGDAAATNRIVGRPTGRRHPRTFGNPRNKRRPFPLGRERVRERFAARLHAAADEDDFGFARLALGPLGVDEAAVSEHVDGLEDEFLVAPGDVKDGFDSEEVHGVLVCGQQIVHESLEQVHADHAFAADPDVRDGLVHSRFHPTAREVVLGACAARTNGLKNRWTRSTPRPRRGSSVRGSP